MQIGCHGSMVDILQGEYVTFLPCLTSFIGAMSAMHHLSIVVKEVVSKSNDFMSAKKVKFASLHAEVLVRFISVSNSSLRHSEPSQIGQEIRCNLE